jgi:hypothetical protein
MFPRRFLHLASVLAILLSPSAAVSASDPTVAELVRLLQDGSDYLMKMIASSDPRVSEILLKQGSAQQTSSSSSTATTQVNATANSTFMESLENDLDALFTNFLYSIDPNSANAAKVRIASRSGSVSQQEEESVFSTSHPSCFPGWYRPKSTKNAKIFGPQLGITLRAGECRVVKNITSALRKIECDSPSIAYALLPGGITAKGETGELFAGETCGISEADRDLVEISKADRLISFDDPLVVGLSDFA